MFEMTCAEYLLSLIGYCSVSFSKMGSHSPDKCIMTNERSNKTHNTKLPTIKPYSKAKLALDDQQWLMLVANDN